MGFLNFFGNLTDRIFTVLLAVIFSQIPIYMNQYTQVLSGAHLESESTYLELEARAAQYDQTVEAFLYELTQNQDPKVKDNAEVSLNTVERYLDYDKALKSLEGSNAFTRPFNFIKHFDNRIRAALKFKPGILLNWEGFTYGVIGVILAMILMGFFGKIFKKKKAEPVV